MALTVAKVEPRSINTVGSLRASTVTVTFDSSYATGGESFTPADAGLATINIVLVSQPASYHVVYDYTNQKFLAYQSGTASAVLNQVANTTDLSAVAFKALVIGT